ncbi:hypothetical protein MGL_3713 [Malassezia globosa CBS 7966]|uniref:Chromatin associated protein KTI12 n=1 Tax=Malassezia globosa (strain ATCC MYA-4612 / CBS 7966) TaxID=425265 RepID=A8QAF4_MALGO|nr:uncharacterized protein MGL_3713 [Malassezia globosa CBS 7966]EDP42032.1 hypothetical protein MGL_3713 [Malassezia globosa CBS 7966]
MALLVVTGLPCSGRTTRVQEIRANFESRLASSPTLSSVRVVQDADVHVDRHVYESQRTEGRARAAYLSAVRRALSTSAIVIADGGAGLNIKGSRYELWCAARELGLRCATLYVACTQDLCRAWNAKRRAHGEPCYTDACLDELMFRFEEPTPEARWHRPLFTTTSVGSADHPECLPTPLDAIWDAMTLAQVQPPKAVTAVLGTSRYHHTERTVGAH